MAEPVRDDDLHDEGLHLNGAPADDLFEDAAAVPRGSDQIDLNDPDLERLEQNLLGLREPKLKDKTIERILEFRAADKTFSTLAEIETLPGMNSTTFAAILDKLQPCREPLDERILVFSYDDKTPDGALLGVNEQRAFDRAEEAIRELGDRAVVLFIPTDKYPYQKGALKNLASKDPASVSEAEMRKLGDSYAHATERGAQVGSITASFKPIASRACELADKLAKDGITVILQESVVSPRAAIFRNALKLERERLISAQEDGRIDDIVEHARLFARMHHEYEQAKEFDTARRVVAASKRYQDAVVVFVAPDARANSMVKSAGRAEVIDVPPASTRPMNSISFIEQYQALGLPDLDNPEARAAIYKFILARNVEAYEIALPSNNTLNPVASRQEFIEMIDNLSIEQLDLWFETIENNESVYFQTNTERLLSKVHRTIAFVYEQSVDVSADAAAAVEPLFEEYREQGILVTGLTTISPSYRVDKALHEKLLATLGETDPETNIVVWIDPDIAVRQEELQRRTAAKDDSDTPLATELQKRRVAGQRVYVEEPNNLPAVWCHGFNAKYAEAAFYDALKNGDLEAAIEAAAQLAQSRYLRSKIGTDFEQKSLAAGLDRYDDKPTLHVIVRSAFEVEVIDSSRPLDRKFLSTLENDEARARFSNDYLDEFARSGLSADSKRGRELLTRYVVSRYLDQFDEHGSRRYNAKTELGKIRDEWMDHLDRVPRKELEAWLKDESSKQRAVMPGFEERKGMKAKEIREVERAQDRENRKRATNARDLVLEKGYTTLARTADMVEVVLGFPRVAAAIRALSKLQAKIRN